jgi:SOS-response transcriptional repressor LexA
VLDDIPLDLPLAFRCPSSGETLDLNALLTPRPISTFYMRVGGHGLRAHGVSDGDLLVIDRSIPPSPGVLVVAEHRREFLLRPLGREGEQWVLEPVRPGELAIPVEVDNLDESPLFVRRHRKLSQRRHEN